MGDGFEGQWGLEGSFWGAILGSQFWGPIFGVQFGVPVFGVQFGVPPSHAVFLSLPGAPDIGVRCGFWGRNFGAQVFVRSFWGPFQGCGLGVPPVLPVVFLPLPEAPDVGVSPGRHHQQPPRRVLEQQNPQCLRMVPQQRKVPGGQELVVQHPWGHRDTREHTCHQQGWPQVSVTSPQGTGIGCAAILGKREQGCHQGGLLPLPGAGTSFGDIRDCPLPSGTSQDSHLLSGTVPLGDIRDSSGTPEVATPPPYPMSPLGDTPGTPVPPHVLGDTPEMPPLVSGTAGDSR